MQPKQQGALDLLLAGHPTTEVAALVGVRRETLWRWTQDPAFAAEVSRRQAERRQATHAELDAGVLEAVQMLRGLVADPEAPAGARVRAATARMDRAGLTPAYAVEVRHRDDQQALQATEFQDPEVMARQILEALPQVIAMLPPTEIRAVLERVEGLLYSWGHVPPSPHTHSPDPRLRACPHQQTHLGQRRGRRHEFRRRLR